MNTTSRYRYEIPPHLTVLLILFYLGLSAWMAYLAIGYAMVRVGLVVLSALFGTLALVVLIRRLAFPCTLELTDNAILLPCGHPWPRIKAILYADIISIQDCGDSLWINTGRGTFWMKTIQFEGYHAALEIISSKIAIEPEPLRGTGCRPTFYSHVIPKPLVQWEQPEDWARFRSRTEISKPVLYHLRTELWFFVCCYAVCCAFLIVCGGLLLLLCIFMFEALPLAAVSVRALVGASILAIIFTPLHWLDRIYPVPPETKISFRDRGITARMPSGQLFNWDYRQFCGWAVVERQFKGHVLQILVLKQLVKGRAYTHEFAFPDASVRDQVLQILNDRHVPQAPDLKPSWEAE
ncbi:MAG: hypothetical protein HY290_19885 [Planctomycetia bacterium]|nr:hypothetical protein [Planctomycetia bacterium]